MLHTERTDQAYKLLKSYARTPEQIQAVKEAYIEMLDIDSEDQVVLRVIGCIFDGLRFGNWLWNTPPNAKQGPPDTSIRVKSLNDPSGMINLKRVFHTPEELARIRARGERHPGGL